MSHHGHHQVGILADEEKGGGGGGGDDSPPPPPGPRRPEDPCSPDPCSSGGTCEAHDGTFSCLCPPGRAGERCQRAVDPLGAGAAGVGFAAAAGSAAALETPQDAVSRWEVEAELRPLGGGDGVVLYAESAEERKKKGAVDFLSVAIVKG